VIKEVLQIPRGPGIHHETSGYLIVPKFGFESTGL
jgi:hypothetical protein